MSARDRGVSTEIPAALDAEGPLRRWSRRKREAVREKEAADEARGGDASRAPSEAVQDAREPAGDASAPAAVEEKDLTDDDMPPLDNLDENSDYSGFLSPGVSEGLRRRALRKLFMSAVFNVRDGLDDYDEGFTNFEALGDIVTSDMRHQAEAESERARQARADSGPEDLPEDDSGRAEAGPAAGAAEDEADAARAGADGMPEVPGHRPSEETGVPEFASGEDAAGTEAGTATATGTGSAIGEDGGPPANTDGGAGESVPGGRAMAGTAAVSEGVVAAGPETGDAAGNRGSAGSPDSAGSRGPPEPGPPGAGAGDPASDATDRTAGAAGDRRA